MSDAATVRYGPWILVFAGISALLWAWYVYKMITNNREDPYRLRTVLLSFGLFSAATAFFIQAFSYVYRDDDPVLSAEVTRLVATAERAILFIIIIVLVITYGSVPKFRRPPK